MKRDLRRRVEMPSKTEAGDEVNVKASCEDMLLLLSQACLSLCVSKINRLASKSD